MSCWIEIDNVVGERLSGNATRSVTVIGRASTDCNRVLVTIGSELRSGANVGADGGWIAVFWTHGMVGCAEEIKIDARCENNLDCGTGLVTLPVVTEKDGCPPVTLVIQDERGKIIDTDKAVAVPSGRYSARVLVPVGPGHNYHWMVDGQLRPGHGEELEFDLLPGTTRVVAVAVETDDPKCSPSDFFTLESEASDWPMSVEFEFVDSAGEAVDPDLGLESGRYTIKVVEPSDNDYILEYAWFVDGIEIPGKQRSFFNYNLAEGADVRILALVKPQHAAQLSGTLLLSERRSPRGDRPDMRPPRDFPGTGEAEPDDDEAIAVDQKKPDKLAVYWLSFWIVGFGVGGVLAYWRLWWPAGAAFHAVYAVFLAVWLWRCCWPEARRYWECKAFLQWHYLATGGALILSAASYIGQQLWNLAAPGISTDAPLFGDGLVAVPLILAALHLGCLYAIGRISGRLPNILRPDSYPPLTRERP